jgi:hypothetical protein
MDEATYKRLLAKAKQMRMRNSRVVTVDGKLDIVMLQLHLRRERAVNKNKRGRPSRQKITDSVASQLQRSRQVCFDAWMEFLKTECEERLQEPASSGMRGTKIEKIKRSNELIYALRDYLHDRECDGNEL